MRPLFAALVLFSTQARAYDFKRDSTGAMVKWSTTASFVADQNLEAALKADGAREALGDAVAQLAQSAPGLSVTLADGSGGKMGYDFSAGAKNRSDVIALDDWEYDDDAVAVTIITVDTRTHAIVDADIAFNTHGNAFAVVNGKVTANRYDVQNAFTHELGHAVGLAHSQDSEAVMFGKTQPGETKKRQFDADDDQALAQLYPAASIAAADASEPAQGCSTTPAGPMGFFGLFALARIRARRIAAVAALVAGALPFTAQAADSIANTDKPVKVAMVGTVKKATTLPPKDGATVLKTELEVQVKECLSTPCPATVKVYVPGGRWGNFEQRVGGMDTPKEGATVGISRDLSKDAWVRLEPLANDGERDAFFRAHAGRTVTAAK